MPYFSFTFRLVCAGKFIFRENNRKAGLRIALTSMRKSQEERGRSSGLVYFGCAAFTPLVCKFIAPLTIGKYRKVPKERYPEVQ